MLGTLLESRSHPQRRLGGAALSVATHLAVVGAVAAATMRQVDRTLDRPKAQVITFHLPPHPAAPTDRAPSGRGHRSPWTESPVVPRIAISNLAPPSLPPISLGAVAPPSDLEFGPGSAAAGDGPPRGILDGAGDDNAAPWTGHELMMRLLATSKPRYPESLRNAGVDGQVLIRFVVDTAGRIEPSSVQVLSATHPLFVRAVTAALGGFRFRPAEIAGRRVEATAEMPFEFSISRTR